MDAPGRTPTDRVQEPAGQGGNEPAGDPGRHEPMGDPHTGESMEVAGEQAKLNAIEAKKRGYPALPDGYIYAQHKGEFTVRRESKNVGPLLRVTQQGQERILVDDAGSRFMVDPSGTARPYDRYDQLIVDHGVKQAVADGLRNHTVDLASVEEVVDLGANRVAVCVHTSRYGESVLPIMRALIDRGIAPEQAVSLGGRAGQVQMTAEVLELVSSPLLRNPEGLDKSLKAMQKELKNTGKSVDQHGVHLTISDAASRVRKGHAVSIEGPHGDLVDHTANETIRQKRVSGRSIKAFVHNLQYAAKQLTGSTGEVPIGKRVIHIDISNPKHPFFNVDEVKLQSEIDMIKQRHPDTFDSTDEIRITNGHGEFTFQP